MNTVKSEIRKRSDKYLNKSANHSNALEVNLFYSIEILIDWKVTQYKIYLTDLRKVTDEKVNSKCVYELRHWA
jgi:hypothetical protein